MLSRLKQAVDALPHPLLLSGYQAVFGARQLGAQWVARRQAQLGWFPNISSFRNSNTLYILGSGSSINRIQDVRWDAIRAHDSFAFNYFLRHPHIPSLYAMESLESRMHPSKVVQWLQLAHSRADEFAAVPKLFTDLRSSTLDMFELLPSSWSETSYTVATVSTYARDRAELIRSIRWAQKAGLFAFQGPPVLFKYRATLSMLVGLAARAGYRNVILCGVDLNDPEYFYQDPNRYPDMKDFASSRRLPQHTTLVQKARLMPIDQILYAMDELVLKPAGINLYVEHEGSALYPSIPLPPQGL